MTKKKKCEYCKMAQELKEESCSSFKIRLLESLTAAHNDDMAIMNELLKQFGTNKSPEEVLELVNFIKDVSITSALVHAAHISLQKGDTLGDFVAEAAELWVDVQAEPARALMNSFVEHLNGSVIKNAAKRHSPDN